MFGLRTLHKDQREVIVLKIWHNCTFQEIAELLDVSSDTVAGRYYYGLDKLKTFIKEGLYERDDRVGEAVVFMDAVPPLSEA